MNVKVDCSWLEVRSLLTTLRHCWIVECKHHVRFLEENHYLGAWTQTAKLTGYDSKIFYFANRMAVFRKFGSKVYGHIYASIAWLYRVKHNATSKNECNYAHTHEPLLMVGPHCTSGIIRSVRLFTCIDAEWLRNTKKKHCLVQWEIWMS